jgi:hypothetical protein
MEATQNRVNRRLIGYLAAPALATVIGFGAHLAFADTVSPQNTAFTASSTNVSFKVGIATVSCTMSSAGGTTPSGSTSPGVEVCANISNPTFSTCTGTALGIHFTAAINANSNNGSWQFCLAASGPTGKLRIPAGGVVATATIGSSHCTTTSGAATAVSGPWSNGSSLVTFTNASVPVTTSGPFPCPSATSATFSGGFTGSPALTVSNP